MELNIFFPYISDGIGEDPAGHISGLLLPE